MNRVLVIIQARSYSKRFPRKILKPLGDFSSSLEFLIHRLKQCRYPFDLIVATTRNHEDDLLASLVESLGVNVFRGSERDVLQRYEHAAQIFNARTIVRITADCPLIDPNMLDQMLETFSSKSAEFMSNQFPIRYPDGFDIDIFSSDLLERANIEAIDEYDREHVTPYMKKLVLNKILGFPCEGDYSALRVTLDEEEDLKLIREIVNYFKPRSDFSWKEVVNLLHEKPELVRINSHLVARVAVQESSGEKLYRRAKKIIPGGNSLLSKRPEMFLPNGWPNYFSKAKGINVWDIDGKKYTDMSIMGIGTNTLGYANNYVDDRVIDAIKNSNMSTLNPPEEVFLAERLLEIHPWFQKARFARTGGEANAMALRIARAAAGKTKVAVCGYHGWHDWYLATNLANRDSLRNHLLPGLSTNGVPNSLGDEIVAFTYNDFKSMRSALFDDNVGVVFMEVMRSMKPESGFLEEIRDICNRRGKVLIFDECTSGFRQTFGGLHKEFSIRPDIAVFGKALGNGYAITSILGVDSIMQYAQETFMSSTFWSEKIGFVAGLATLDEMERTRSWEMITRLGSQMMDIWRSIFESNGMDVKITGIPALASHSFLFEKSGVLKTYITQEMLNRYSVFSSNIFYPSTAHTSGDITNYAEKLDLLVKEAKPFIESGTLHEKLNGPVSHVTFSRLN